MLVCQPNSIKKKYIAEYNCYKLVLTETTAALQRTRRVNRLKRPYRFRFVLIFSANFNLLGLLKFSTTNWFSLSIGFYYQSVLGVGGCTCVGKRNLKIGCFVIGYLQLVGEIILSIVVLVTLVAGRAAVATGKDEAQAVGAGFLAVGIILLLFLALPLAFTITLLVGLHKNKSGHVKAYLIFSAVILVLYVILFFVAFILMLIYKRIALNLIFFLIQLGVHLYFLLVIKSQYHKMNDQGVISNNA